MKHTVTLTFQTTCENCETVQEAADLAATNLLDCLQAAEQVSAVVTDEQGNSVELLANVLL